MNENQIFIMEQRENSSEKFAVNIKDHPDFRGDLKIASQKTEDFRNVVTGTITVTYCESEWEYANECVSYQVVETFIFKGNNNKFNKNIFIDSKSVKRTGFKCFNKSSVLYN